MIVNDLALPDEVVTNAILKLEHNVLFVALTDLLVPQVSISSLEHELWVGSKAGRV